MDKKKKVWKMRISKASQKQDKKDLSRNLSFEKWLDYFIKPPTKQELDDMEKTMTKNHFKFKSTNNTNYQPLQGA